MTDPRWGLTLPLPTLPLAQHAEHVRRAEAAGYTDLWSGETQGPDGFTPLALAAAWTERARLGTGVVGVFTRGPALLAQQAAALADASGGRFALGIGASSDRIVEGWNRMPFERPLTKMSETLDFLREVLGGGRAEGGFKLEQPPAERVPIIVAALRGKCSSSRWQRATGRSPTSCRSGACRRSPPRSTRPPRASSSCAASSAFRASAPRSSRWRASCSRPTPRSPSTRRSFAGSATASRSTRWSRRGRSATASAPRRPRRGG